MQDSNCQLIKTKIGKAPQHLASAEFPVEKGKVPFVFFLSVEIQKTWLNLRDWLGSCVVFPGDPCKNPLFTKQNLKELW